MNSELFTVEFIINNYSLSLMRMTPVDHIIEQERIDRYHTKVVYEGLTENQVIFCEKVYAKKAKEI